MNPDTFFSVAFRNQVRDHILRMAKEDRRVVAGAIVGSLALSEGDRWSDLDLTFAVDDDINQIVVLDDWTKKIVETFDAAILFDLPAGPSIYRVFLLPGCLQFDLSFTPASKFGAVGPKFKLIFGSAVEKPFPQPSPAVELFGYAVHHALRARFCIERGKLWQAEHWVSETRNLALALACRRRNLPTQHGRGFDQLPAETLDFFRDGFVASLNSDELLRALGCTIKGLLIEADEVRALAQKVEPQLQTLLSVREGS